MSIASPGFFISIVQIGIASIYLSSSLLSFAALIVYKYQSFSHSWSFFNTIFLFGKFATKSEKFSFLLVPKRWFYHFYITAVLTAFATLLASLNSDQSLATKMALLLVSVQVSKRLYESLFVQIFSNSVMSIAHYFSGHYFYLTMPLSIYWSDNHISNRENASTIFCAILATVVIFLQHIVMVQLADIRKRISKEMPKTYHLPTGCMFKYLTCPHFALEISLYALIHVLLGPRLLPYTPTFLFVLSNQISSGVLNHAWYQKHHPEFASSRKIFFPYIF